MNESQTKICQNCKQKFTIEPEDFDFYEKVSAPAPTQCWQCRMQWRLAHRNERTLYQRTCDRCNKTIIAVYPSGTLFPVYCVTCWWSDNWDAKNYGMTYNPDKSFFEQFKALQEKVPRMALVNMRHVNSEYANMSADNKNCYLIFAAEQNEDCYYSRLIQNCRSVVDSSWIYDSELCYECVDCRKCYNCLFSERCQASTDLLFCFDVRDSHHLILCTNLRHRSYCIENKQYSKEEYEKKKQEILASYKSIEETKKHLSEFTSRTLVKYAFQTKCVRAVGDYLYNCHDAYMIFDVSNAKECAYLADAEDPIDCWDGNNIYYKPERCLEVMSALQINRCKYSSHIFICNDVEYCDNCHTCSDCFGCIGLKKGSYSILNKQYSKEEYNKTKDQIITSMKEEGVYGLFFPPSLSLFGYNETLAQDYFPLSRDKTLQKGFQWQDKEMRTRGKETIPLDKMPDTIEEADKGVLKDILVCKDCKRNYKLTPFEFSFYQKMHLPLPRKDFECRHRERFNKRTPKQIWHRKCQCAGEKSDNSIYKNTVEHFHKQDHCPNEFETTYAPERKEIVYCEKCYQDEVV
ncbi:hypothetical protein MYX07_00090 [Patescibacteria group bacterium AH-259-L07]|nr:hypothetical protein [Patescibacteria group bacterium AH-259-L07]